MQLLSPSEIKTKTKHTDVVQDEITSVQEPIVCDSVKDVEDVFVNKIENNIDVCTQICAENIQLEIFRNRSEMEAQIILKNTGEIIDRIPVTWKARQNNLDYLSVSKMQAYSDCPACFNRLYISDETTEIDGGNFYTYFGSIMHHVVERASKIYDENGIIIDPVSLFNESYKDYNIGFDAYEEGKALIKSYFDFNPINMREDKAVLIEKEWRGQLGGCTFGLQLDYAGIMKNDPTTGVLKDYKSNRAPFTNAELQSSLQLRIYEIVLRRFLMPEIQNWRSGYEMFRFGWQECPTRTEDDLKSAEDYVAIMWDRISNDNTWDETLNNYCGYRECRHTCKTYQKFVANPSNFIIKSDNMDIAEVERQRSLMVSFESIAKTRKEELGKVVKQEIEECAKQNKKLIIGGSELSLYSNATRSYDYFNTKNVLLAHNKLDLLDGCLSIGKTKMDAKVAGDPSLKLALAGAMSTNYASPYIMKSKALK